ncbi:melanoma cell adhesion molecule b isoform X2 [Parambassis ranga]|uniref:Melanoma cell adhesion molecule b isoform X2 n=1 Tax=Parambassis ranga TaxID=210632 RepID=A0A6P7JCL7_9TELE|nr:cell surface glycoprotein MUC18 isoform X2 [Parambassis ranga]
MALRNTVALLVGLVALFHTWGAWAIVEVNMEDKVEVSIKETAQITCMYTSDEGSGGMVIEWFYVTRSGDKQRIYHQDPVSNTVDKGTPYMDRINVSTATGVVVLTISDVQVEDEREFTCRIKGLTDGSGEGRTKLRVFATPERPTIEAVETGVSVDKFEPSKIGTCEVKNGYPRPNVTWYRDNMPLLSSPDTIIEFRTTTESNGLLSVVSELSRKVVKEDKNAKFYCEVNYFVPGATQMTESAPITITIYYPSTEVYIWVESPKGKIKEGDVVELRCTGNGNDPSALLSIKHTRSGETWETDTAQINATRINSGEYECQIVDTESFESLTNTTEVFVNYLDPAVVVPEQPAMVLQGKDVMATCNAVSSLQTETTWFKDGEEISKGHTLILTNATFDTSGTYTCVVSVTELEDMQTNGTLIVHVQGPPQIRKDRTVIETVNREVDLKCHVRGYPVPTIIWTAGGKVSKGFQKVTENGVESVLKVQVTSDMTAVCNASNEYGSDTSTFNIKAIAHTTTQATSTTTTTTISNPSVKTETAKPPKKVKKESNGVIIAVVIICLLLLAVLGSVLYFLYKKGKICGRSGKQDLTKSNKDNIVVEMKSDNTEEAILLGVNGEKQPQSHQ